MIGKLTVLMIVATMAACTAGPRATPLKEPDPVVPKDCDAVRRTWMLQVKFDNSSLNRGAAKDVEQEVTHYPPINPRELRVKSCDNVRFKVHGNGRNANAMVAFDKTDGFLSPGQQPAYISRRGYIIVPIDNRPPPEGSEYK